MIAKRVNIPNAEFGHDDIAVVVNGEVIRTFNSLSDDYAITNAGEFAVVVNDRIARGVYNHQPMTNADGTVYIIKEV